MLLRRLPFVLASLSALTLAVGCNTSKTQNTGDTSVIGHDGDSADTGGVDADGDGYFAGTGANSDCNDADPTVNPGATEICNGVDDNCDGYIDNNASDATTWYTDADGDGYGDPNAAVVACDQPGGTVADNTDCDDTSARYHPGADESDCSDPNDYNCDGSVGYADADGDSYPACQDCNDAESAINPAAIEVCDGVDNNCDGLTDDADPTVDPSTESTFYADSDADTYGDPNTPVLACAQPTGAVADNTDCDDTVAAVNPGATEVCNGIDDDCDALIDDADPSLDVSTTTTWYTDADTDGYGAGAGVQACEAPAGDVSDNTDCNDADPAYHPGADESDCADPNDYNCDGSVGYADADGDGYAACQDCNDGEAAINPGATEVCDGVDNNCDGLTDDADPAVDPSTETTWHTDADADGYGSSAGTTSCDAPSGTVADSTDCDDANAAINPGASEVCDGIDNDCDTLIDDADPSLDASTTSMWYADADNDGYGAGTAVSACDAPAGSVSTGTDCDDGNGAVHPGASEVCNGIDDDCDGAIDDADSDLDLSTATSWYTDGDSDGYGAGTGALACDQPAGSVSDGTDCNDADAAINPGATEVCDGIDNDCDTLIDDADPSIDPASETRFHRDADSDGYGAIGIGALACSAAPGLVADATDCDDGDAAVNPGATEVCNGFDDDCDALVDDADPSLDATTGADWYADADNDGYGAGSAVQSCEAPAGSVSDNTDCDDADPAINPAATEVCDGVDNDCDTLVDDADPSLDTSSAGSWYADKDSDGYGAGAAIIACDQPAGDVADNTDCNDLNRAINPGATEICDALNTDENCNGTADDADPTVDPSTQTMYYADADSDGYGAMTGTLYCDAPAGATTDHSDCNDASAAAHPGGTEICDNLDNDCDGSVDWGNRVPSDYPTIQAGIDGATDGETVCVEAGTYTEQIDLAGKAITLMGTGGSGVTTIDGGGTGPVVTVDSGETTSTVVDGFTITGGSAGTGAGVTISNSSPTLTDLSITGNSCVAANCYGTGLYAVYSDAVLDNVSVSGNSATATTFTEGVGASFVYSSPTVTNSQFNANTTTTTDYVYGTGLYISYDGGTAASFSNVSVDENVTTLTDASYGNQYGSVYVSYAGPRFDNVTVDANEGYDGYNVWTPAVCEYGGSSTWTRTEMLGNIADTYYADAAGLREMYSSSSWTNVTIAGNQAIATYTILASGAFVDRSSSAKFTNVDISHNSADGEGTASVWSSALGEHYDYYTIAFDNVIIADNTVTNAASSYTGGVFTSGYISFAYSDIYGNTGSNVYGITDPTGTGGNISADPLYVDTAPADPRNWDLSLSAGSPAANTGDPAILNSDGSRSDMGGYGGPAGSSW